MIDKPVPSIAEIDSLYSLFNFGIEGIKLSDEICIGNYTYSVLNNITDSVKKVKRK